MKRVAFPLMAIVMLGAMMSASRADAGTFSITPPATLNLDGDNIVAGIFTLLSFDGIDAIDLSTTNIVPTPEASELGAMTLFTFGLIAFKSRRLTHNAV